MVTYCMQSCVGSYIHSSPFHSRQQRDRWAGKPRHHDMPFISIPISRTSTSHAKSVSMQKRIMLCQNKSPIYPQAQQAWGSPSIINDHNCIDCYQIFSTWHQSFNYSIFQINWGRRFAISLNLLQNMLTEQRTVGIDFLKSSALLPIQHIKSYCHWFEG